MCISYTTYINYMALYKHTLNKITALYKVNKILHPIYTIMNNSSLYYLVKHVIKINNNYVEVGPILCLNFLRNSLACLSPCRCSNALIVSISVKKL